MIHISYPYDKIKSLEIVPDQLGLVDHLNGFDDNYNNPVLSLLSQQVANQTTVVNVRYHQILPNQVLEKYSSLNIKFDSQLQQNLNFSQLLKYNIHPEVDIQNFICSFNGTPHVGRKLLVSILDRFGWFNEKYCSKNFVFTIEQLDGHIIDYTMDQSSFYLKFFIGPNSEVFFNQLNSFGHERFAHSKNIYNLESKLAQSFINIVSESLPTSRCPFVTEKFLYSIVTRGLFLAYAQPGWHEHLEKYYGFKRYTKLFDYNFDFVINPVERLINLMSMLSKFSMLSSDDWRDLYLLEQDTVEYNYHHYFSQDYLKCLAKFS